MEITPAKTVIFTKEGSVVIAADRPIATHFLPPAQAREWAAALLRAAEAAERNLAQASAN